MRSARGGHRTWRRGSWLGLARNVSKPSVQDSRARYEARSLRMWWTPDKGMLHLRGQLPDVTSAKFEAKIAELTEQMRPVKGQGWDSFEHRVADALELSCDELAATDETATLARSLVQVWVPPRGPAEIAGIPSPTWPQHARRIIG